MKIMALKAVSVITALILLLTFPAYADTKTINLPIEKPILLPDNLEDIDLEDIGNADRSEMPGGDTVGGSAGSGPPDSSQLQWIAGNTGYSLYLKDIAAKSSAAADSAASGGSGLATSSGNAGESVKYAAVGIAGAILTSNNGEDWTLRTSGTNDWLYGVGYFNESFVAVGGNLVYQSNSSDSAIINWLSDKIVGSSSNVYSSGRILTSQDGINWTDQPSGVPLPLFGVAAGNGSLVAVGMSGEIITSTDGINWNSRNSKTGEFLFGVAYRESMEYGMVGSGDNNALYAAVGNKGTILTSPDGNNWTSHITGTSKALYCVDYFNGRFVAAGEAGIMLTSEDGKVWIPAASGTTKDIKCISHGDGSFIAAGEGGLLMKSINGIIWERQASSSDSDLAGIVYQEGGFLIVGGNGTLVYSSIAPGAPIVNTPEQAGADTETVSAPPTGTQAGETQKTEDDILTATPGNSVVSLLWKEAIDKNGLDGYYIYKGTGPGGEDTSPINDFPVEGSSYEDKDVINGTAYYYIVKPSYNKGKLQGAPSNEAVAVPEYGLAADKGVMVLNIGDPNMTVNGSPQEIDPGKGTAPLLKNGKTCVPIRAIIENMGGSVAWSSVEQRVDINLGEIELKLWIDKTTAKVNGKEASLQLAPYISNTGRTMIPLRFVVENLGCDVEWDSAQNRITINYSYDKKGLEDQQLIDQLKGSGPLIKP